jgi:hypothetical protein
VIQKFDPLLLKDPLNVLNVLSPSGYLTGAGRFHIADGIHIHPRFLGDILLF